MRILQLVIAVVSLAAGGALSACGGTEESLDHVAMEWVRLLDASRFDEAAARVAPGARDALSTEDLAKAWSRTKTRYGSLRSLLPGSRSESGGLRIRDLDGRFERGRRTVRVVFDTDGRIAGFWLRPYEPPWTWQAPAYVNRKTFVEQEIRVGAAPWDLPGTLSLPVGGRPTSGVVLVHGSGPNDRDETLGRNKPFRDLAYGLATRGITVLRYEKRTRVYRGRMAQPISLEAETIDDALAALTLLRARPEVDPQRVFLLGHSLGGALAPEIARREGGSGGGAAHGDPTPSLARRLAGIILLGAPGRRYTAMLREQLQYLTSLERRGALEALDRLDAYDAGKLPPQGTITGSAQRPYYEFLDALDPVATARALEIPILVLHGGRDYHMSGADLAGWQHGLSGSAWATVKDYPKLNHLFAAGEGRSTPDEYEQEQHVDLEVIEDLAKWIETRS